MATPSTLSTRFPRPDRNAVLLGLRPVQVALLLIAVIAATVPNTRSTGVAYGRRINFRPLSGSVDVGG